MSTLSQGEDISSVIPAENNVVNDNSPLARLKKYSGRLVVTSLLSGTLLLGACGDTSSDDCVPQSTPPTPPASSGFTAARPSDNSGTYCRSRTTGGYYYSGSRYGGGYYGGSSASS